MKRIRVGILGAGHWGPNLIRNFHANRSCELVAVADTNSNRLKLIQERYPDVAVTKSAEVILNDPLIEAVVICTPTGTHFELAKLALQNKKHTFVEKPLATSAEECATLISLARKEKRVLFVGHVFVYNAGIQAVRRYIESGELGRIYYIDVTRTNLGPVRDDCNALWDLGSHDLSILMYWLAELPVKVSAVGGRFLNKKREDAVFATFTFPGNILANLHVSWLNPKKVREIVIVGEKKMLVWDDLDLSNPIRLYDKKVLLNKEYIDTFIDFHASIHEGDTLIPKIRLNEPLLAECDAFLEATRNPASFLSTGLSTGEDGRSVVQILEAVDESLADGGREVKVRKK